MSRPPWRTALGLLLITSSVLLTNLNYPLLEPDELRFGQVALEMYESGNLLTPTLYGRPYLDKPPLLFWLVTASYHVFGVHEWSARLPSTAAAMGSVLAVFLLGRRVMEERAAAIGSLLLLCCAAFPLTGRFLNMDGLLTSCTTCAFLALCAGWQSPRVAARWFALAGCACALGVLAKGPVALALCVPPAVLVAWLNRHRQPTSRWLALWLVGPTLVLAVPWFAWSAAHEAQFAGHFFWKHHFVRFFDAFHHREPWWFYVPVLAVGMFPCSLLFPGLAARVFRRSGTTPRREPAMAFAVLAAVWIMVFFSMSSCKLPTYVLPVLPLLCLACGRVLDGQISRQTEEMRAARRGFSSVASWSPRALSPLLIAVLWCVIGWSTGIAHWMFRPLGLGGILLLGAYGLLCAALVLAATSRFSNRQRWLAAAALVLLVEAYGFDRLLPEVARWRSLSLPAARLRESLGGESVPVVYYNRSRIGGGFYVRGGQVVEFVAAPAEEIQGFFQRHPLAVLVTTQASVDELRRYCPQLSVTPAGGRGHLFVSRPTERLAVRPVR